MGTRSASGYSAEVEERLAHRYDRPIGPEEYDELCRRVAAVVKDATPAGAVVAVVSKGDPRLLEIEGRTGLHFPRDAEGRYAGYHPKTSEDAIAQVESVRGAGAQFLCLPATATWWLDHYQGLAAWLGAHCRVAAREPEVCVVYDLSHPARTAIAAAEPVAATTVQLRSLLDALLPEDAFLLVIGFPSEGLASPGRTVEPLATSHAVAQRRLEASTAERPTFVLVAQNDLVAPLDAAFEDLLARHTEPVARRERLCDVLQVRVASPRRSGIMRPDRSDADSSADPGSASRGGVVEKPAGPARAARPSGAGFKQRPGPAD